MSLNAVKILKIPVTNSSKKDILEEIQKYLDKNNKKSQKPLKIYTPNAEQLVLAQKNPAFAQALNRADIAIPDSNGVVWASKILTKNPIQATIPGIELMEELVAMVAKRHVPVGLIGGFGNLAVEALDCLQSKHAGLTGWAEGGEPRIEYFAKRIKESGVRVVFVALGAPKQEFFIEELSKKTLGVVFMAVGGSFAIISGRLPRAPLVLRKLSLEWFWRLLLEPWRIFRQLALIEFLWLVFREQVRLRK